MEHLLCELWNDPHISFAPQARLLKEKVSVYRRWLGVRESLWLGRKEVVWEGQRVEDSVEEGQGVIDSCGGKGQWADDGRVRRVDLLRGCGPIWDHIFCCMFNAHVYLNLKSRWAILD